MEIIKLVNKIYKKLEKDPYLLFSENDLTCQIYQELIKDDSKRVFTEWSIKDKGRIAGNRIGRLQFDFVVCDKSSLVFDGKSNILISYFEKIMELKLHWQTSGNHMFNQMERDYHKLKALSDDLVKNKYMIAFNLHKKNVSQKRLMEWSNKLGKANIIFIYKYLNTRSLF